MITDDITDYGVSTQTISLCVWHTVHLGTYDCKFVTLKDSKLSVAAFNLLENTFKFSNLKLRESSDSKSYKSYIYVYLL